jgi:hypothetical protein
MNEHFSLRDGDAVWGLVHKHTSETVEIGAVLQSGTPPTAEQKYQWLLHHVSKLEASYPSWYQAIEFKNEHAGALTNPQFESWDLSKGGPKILDDLITLAMALTPFESHAVIKVCEDRPTAESTA